MYKLYIQIHTFDRLEITLVLKKCKQITWSVIIVYTAVHISQVKQTMPSLFMSPLI